MNVYVVIKAYTWDSDGPSVVGVCSTLGLAEKTARAERSDDCRTWVEHFVLDNVVPHNESDKPKIPEGLEYFVRTINANAVDVQNTVDIQSKKIKNMEKKIAELEKTVDALYYSSNLPKFQDLHKEDKL